MDQFHLKKLSHAKELFNLISRPQHLLLKVGSILPTKNPVRLSPFRIPLKDPQNYLDEGIFYATLYLSSRIQMESRDEKQKIEQSRNGLYAFKRELIHYYEKNFQEVPDETQHLFIETHPSNPNEEKKISVYQIPKEVLSFDNVKERPRSPGPKNSFGSGLLLIKKTDYSLPTSASKYEWNLKDSLTLAKKEKSFIMELGSLVQL
jgi:hypothetical protein